MKFNSAWDFIKFPILITLMLQSFLFSYFFTFGMYFNNFIFACIFLHFFAMIIPTMALSTAITNVKRAWIEWDIEQQKQNQLPSILLLWDIKGYYFYFNGKESKRFRTRKKIKTIQINRK
jgi:hypothetical protein